MSFPLMDSDTHPGRKIWKDVLKSFMDKEALMKKKGDVTISAWLQEEKVLGEKTELLKDIETLSPLLWLSSNTYMESVLV